MEPGTLPCDEPKFIVFYGMLLSLFSMFCFNCKSPNPQVDIRKNGSMAVVTLYAVLLVVQRETFNGTVNHIYWEGMLLEIL